MLMTYPMIRHKSCSRDLVRLPGCRRVVSRSEEECFVDKSARTFAEMCALNKSCLWMSLLQLFIVNTKLPSERNLRSMRLRPENGAYLLWTWVLKKDPTASPHPQNAYTAKSWKCKRSRKRCSSCNETINFRENFKLTLRYYILSHSLQWLFIK